MKRNAAPTELTSRDWLGKVVAAVLLGFTASVALTCLFNLVADVRDSFFDARGQIAMWAIAPLWAGILSFCFFFRSARHAWFWLATANVLLWGSYAAIFAMKG